MRISTRVNLQANPSLRRAFAIQWRTLHALLMREIITRFGRKNLGVLWLVGEPMMFTVGVATLWTVAGLHSASPIPIVAFAITGYSSVLMWRNSASRASSAVEQNKSLLFHRNVRILDVLLTRTLVEISGATCSFVILSCICMFVGWMPPPVDVQKVITGWVMLAWFGTGMAILIGAGGAISEVAERIWHPAAYLLFPISGAAFMVDWLPRSFQTAVLMLPMVHGTEMVREGWFGNVVPTHYDLGYMASACLMLTLVALVTLREASLRVEF
jgi:ABC-type polysaccharide/polyol phosphate export permease